MPDLERPENCFGPFGTAPTGGKTPSATLSSVRPRLAFAILHPLSSILHPPCLPVLLSTFHQLLSRAARGCLDAAAKVLGEKKEPMSTAEMIEQMATKGYWTSPDGKTPAATLYSAILRELKKGKESRFKKTDKGRFALA